LILGKVTWEAEAHVLRTVKALLVGDIVDQQNSHSPSVVRRCDCPEALLPRSVPNLKFDSLAIKLNSPDLEVDANGRNERGRKAILTKAQETA